MQLQQHAFSYNFDLSGKQSFLIFEQTCFFSFHNQKNTKVCKYF